MNSLRPALALVILALTSGSPLGFSAQELAWETGPGFRSAKLELPAAGKTGFTILPPHQTGITFTNLLDEYAGASNRTLYNGSGVAVGDFDNDSWPDIFFCSLGGQNTLYRNLGDWRFADVT